MENLETSNEAVLETNIEETSKIEEVANEDVVASADAAPEPTKESLFTKVYRGLFGSKEEKEAAKSAKDNVATAADVDELEIEQELYDAGKAQGWDDAKIAKYFQEDKSVLEALAKTKPVTKEKVEVKKEEAGVKPTLEKFDLDDITLKDVEDQYGPEVVQKVIKPLMTKLNSTIDMVNQQALQSATVSEKVSKDAMAKQVQAFQENMDKLGDEYEIFGKWEKVPLRADGSIDITNPVVQARGQVWEMAHSLQKNGMSWNAAVDNATAWYKGMNLEKITQSKLIKKLNNQKVHFTARPTSKRTEAPKLTGDAAKVAAIRQSLKVIGKD